ncbi:Normal actin organization and endocytosis [Komagataella phaffii CBS 7435]|uniref:Uncharacterized protein n=2 Tax=Komagataella phaffii TaxID=460519 RepID=C4R5B6_KOMPG|nr:uncharacterized protein PAS_chr3_1210 [Komagataella phaffii GS115]AOA63921.1 GQ67_03793T0 [Komagataella phaffii]CAH2449470.1 Normal actin organization and endocytosis [Komagataella phaffii CBS 7435]AOA68411.1 GQ68_03765T0 [Komagataella phaffii GS115]CAY70752.1 hypothetical protein PAS_chr3_1210 [Komagataella phaffii GS115]CCA39457.1 Normal actin organization and endocytosis [Komagataella phaffii CBS 7435]
MPGFDFLNVPGIPPSREGTTPPPPNVSFGASNPTPSHEPKPNSNPRHQQFDALFDRINSSIKSEQSASKESLNSISSASKDSTTQGVTSSRDSPDIENDVSVPLSLTANQLSEEEVKTYLRWYNDIVTSRGTKTVSIDDVFKFMNNFRIEHKDKIRKLFNSCLNGLNIGQFFALLRLISHVILGKYPLRSMIKVIAPIPKPVSILASRKRQQIEDEESEIDEEMDGQESLPDKNSNRKLDLDSFTQFLLTGEKPREETKRRKKNAKSVKFSDQLIIQDNGHLNEGDNSNIDFTLPMEQLLGRVPPQNVSHFQHTHDEDEEEDEEEELKEMGDSINHFQNVKIDSVLLDGAHTTLPEVKVSSESGDDRPLYFPNIDTLSPTQGNFLQPHLTGSAPKQVRQSIRSPPPPPPVSRQRSKSLDINFEDRTQREAHGASPQPSSQAPTVPPLPPPSRRSRSNAEIQIQQPPTLRSHSHVLAPQNFVSASDDNLAYRTKSQEENTTDMRQVLSNNSSADILGDLQSLQAELDRIKQMTRNI